MSFPDRIERTVTLTRPPSEVWQALTTADGLSAWFGDRATIDLRPGGAATMTFAGGTTVDMRIHVAAARPPRRRPAPHLRRVHPRAPSRRHVAPRRRDRLRPTSRRHPARDLRLPRRRLVTGARRAGGAPQWRLTSRRLPSKSSSRSPTPRAAPSSPPSPRTAPPPPPISRGACRSPAKPSPSTSPSWPTPAWSPPSMASAGGCATGCAPHRYSSPSRFLAALTTAWDDRLDAVQHYLQPP